MRDPAGPNRDVNREVLRDEDLGDDALSTRFLSASNSRDSEQIVQHAWNDGLRWHSQIESTDPAAHPIVVMVRMADSPQDILDQDCAFDLDIPLPQRVIFDTADLTLMIGGEKIPISDDLSGFRTFRSMVLPILRENIDLNMFFLSRELYSYPE